MTQLDAAFYVLEERMRGRRVTGTRIFLYTLQIYLASDASDSSDLVIWFEPSWHIRTPTGVVVGSGAIDGPTDFGDDAEIARADATIRRAGDASRVLVGQALTGLTMDPVTHALTATFTNGFVVATFADETSNDAMWVLHDRENDDAIRGTNRGLARGTREDPSISSTS